MFYISKERKMVKETAVAIIPYEENHMKDEYVMEKMEVEVQEGQSRSRKLPRWSGNRGIEGLLYCFDLFKKFAD